MNIQFKYSHVYETHLNKGAPLLLVGEIEAHRSAIENFWNIHRGNIERVLKEETGLSFAEQEIVCYLNSSKSFSDPLSLKIENTNDMQDNLVHELIHVLLSGNPSDDFKHRQKLLYNRFSDEKSITKIHIIVHAIHAVITEKLFPDRVDAIKNYSTFPAYRRAWDIVEKEGAKEIVRNLFYR